MNGEGKIQIPLEDFFKFVREYNPLHEDGVLIQYGLPKINIENQEMEIDFLFDSKIEPEKWANFNDTEVSKQWKQK